MSDALKQATHDPLHLSRILHELAGAASMCWTPRPSGVFDSQEAIKHVAAAIAEIEQLRAALSAPQPIDMVLHCPKCGAQHIDAPDERTPDWRNESHRSHLCHACGHIWRPADVPTNGVAAVKTTGKADSPLSAPQPAAPQQDEVGWLIEFNLPQIGPASWVQITHDKSSGRIGFGFTTDTSVAARFTRRVDAEQVLAAYFGPHASEAMRAPFSVTEHMWPAAQPAAPQARPYGYCPECGAVGVMRERRPDGDDKCANGHKYQSRTANKEAPAPSRPWCALSVCRLPMRSPHRKQRTDMTPEDILSITRRGYRVNYLSDSAHIDFAKEVIKEHDKEIQKWIQEGEAIMEKQNANTMFRVGKWWGERPWRK